MDLLIAQASLSAVANPPMVAPTPAPITLLSFRFLPRDIAFAAMAPTRLAVALGTNVDADVVTDDRSDSPNVGFSNPASLRCF